MEGELHAAKEAEERLQKENDRLLSIINAMQMPMGMTASSNMGQSMPATSSALAAQNGLIFPAPQMSHVSQLHGESDAIGAMMELKGTASPGPSAGKMRYLGNVQLPPDQEALLFNV